MKPLFMLQENVTEQHYALQLKMVTSKFTVTFWIIRFCEYCNQIIFETVKINS